MFCLSKKPDIEILEYTHNGPSFIVAIVRLNCLLPGLGLKKGCLTVASLKETLDSQIYFYYNDGEENESYIRIAKQSKLNDEIKYRKASSKEDSYKIDKLKEMGLRIRYAPNCIKVEGMD